MAKLVSKTYGDALFELAVEKNILDEVWSEVKVLSEVWESNEELANLLVHPRVNKEEKVSLIKSIFDGYASETILGFLVILVEKGRISELQNVLSYFEDKVREYKKIGVAYVSSATELTEKQKEQMESRLLEVTQYTQFEMNYSVEPDLIGGVVIRIGDRVMDNSIKSKLNAMTRELSKIQTR